MTFFVEWGLGNRFVPNALIAAGEDVVRHCDTHLPPNAPDEEWVALAASKGWLSLTKDLGKGRPLPYEEIHAHKAKVFARRSGNLTGEEMARAFVRATLRMKRMARRAGPFIARVYKGGDVRVWRQGDQILTI